MIKYLRHVPSHFELDEYQMYSSFKDNTSATFSHPFSGYNECELSVCLSGWVSGPVNYILHCMEILSPRALNRFLSGETSSFLITAEALLLNYVWSTWNYWLYHHHHHHHQCYYYYWLAPGKLIDSNCATTHANNEWRLNRIESFSSVSCGQWIVVLPLYYTDKRYNLQTHQRNGRVPSSFIRAIDCSNPPPTTTIIIIIKRSINRSACRRIAGDLVLKSICGPFAKVPLC